MRVLKFGGSSVANADNIRKVLAVVKAQPKLPQVVVVSAFSGITDHLIHTARVAEVGDASYAAGVRHLEDTHLAAVQALLPKQDPSRTKGEVLEMINELEDVYEGVYRLRELSARTLDRILSYGELLSSYIICDFFEAEGLPALWMDSRTVIQTDATYGAARVDKAITYTRMSQKVATAPAAVWVAAGFIASTPSGQTTTLGRGGSDYTAALFAAGLQAEALEIWTDVTGIMTADPRRVPTARTLARVSYQEAMELAHFGAKVIYPPTIAPVMQAGIPLWVKNTFEPDAEGTVVTAASADAGASISGISSIGGIALLNLEGSGMIGVPGVAQKLFLALAQEGINVILITQGSSEHSICLAIQQQDVVRAQEAIDQMFLAEIATGVIEPVRAQTDLCIVAVVGDSMRLHPGISGKMFAALGGNGINILAIAQGSSERNISAVVQESDVRKAIAVLHSTFFEFEYKALHVFIAGSGTVGSRLIEQLRQQAEYLRQHLRINLKVVGIANSRQALLKPEGISLDAWQTELPNAPKLSIDNYVHEIVSLNLPNSVFVDVTASAEVAAVYPTLLAKSISVTACNKIASSSAYGHYQELKALAQEYNTHYLYETNVGAGLPVIGTLADLLRSGDSIRKIEAVLSGTLNFVFNNYDGTRLFAEVVRQAQAEGYTEPDPRLDLGGGDVMRKILILAREAGAALEMDAIANETFLPAPCFDGSVEDFYQEMARQEPHFKALYDAATAQGKKLKFVAVFEDGTARVGLQAVQPESDFFHLYGKDNIILFYTQRYPEQPLVIKGAGAGAEVTASGVFADIVRTVK